MRSFLGSLLLSTIIVACGGRSQLLGERNLEPTDASPDLDASTFVASTPPDSIQFVDVCSMPGATVELQGIDDGMGGTVAIPFAFVFLGQSFTAVTPSADGYIGFGTSGPNWGVYGAFTVPSPNTPAPAFFYYARDLFQRQSGVCMASTGSSPDRRFVIEMLSAYHYNDMSTTLTIETLLEEGTNAIDVIYQTLSGPGTDGSQATVGAQNTDGTRSFVYVHMQPGSLHSGLRVRFVPR